LQNLKRNLNTAAGLFGVVLDVEEDEAICVSLACVEYVLGKWQIKAKFPELKNQVGNSTRSYKYNTTLARKIFSSG